MSKVTIHWDERVSLKEFVSSTNQISLIKRVSGKRNSRNMAIWGENLSALAALKAGSGVAGSPIAVDIIAIDPPYNAGGEQGYKNNWKGVSEQERDWAKDHGAFLDFMEPRLKIGKSLLKEDGIIFVNICDHEFSHLKILMDQVFDDKNYLGTLIWDKGQGSPSSHMTDIHEYILVYAKDAKKAPPLRIEKPVAQSMVAKALELKANKTDYQSAQKIYKTWVLGLSSEDKISGGEAAYRLLHPTSFQPFMMGPSCAQTKRDSRCMKALVHPVTKKKCPVPQNGWKWSEETLMNLYAHDKFVIGDGFVVAGDLVYGPDETSVPRRLNYLRDNMFQKLPSVIHNGYGGDKDLPPGIAFSTPKPVSLIKTLLKSTQKTDAVVLDYFAGSGTTGQAAKELNDEDGGNRSWILIEEMGSTFHRVLLPRLQAVSTNMDFGIFEIQSATVKDQQLFKQFQQYSLEYLSSYHALEEGSNFSKHNMNVLGVDKRASQLVALTLPHSKNQTDYFKEEVASLIEQIKKAKVSSALVYTLKPQNGAESPWGAISDSILKGTLCESLKIVEVPQELIEEWHQVLNAIAA